jgi:hypothetical protein
MGEEVIAHDWRLHIVTGILQQVTNPAVSVIEQLSTSKSWETWP